MREYDYFRPGTVEEAACSVHTVQRLLCPQAVLIWWVRCATRSIRRLLRPSFH